MSVLPGPVPQRTDGQGRDCDGSWNQHSVRDLQHASHAADSVLLDLKRAGYSQRDVAGMRVALDQAIGNALLSRNKRQPEELCLAVRYRINQSYAAVEVEVHGATGSQTMKARTGELKIAGLSKSRATPRLVPYLTWIRYSRKDHSATLCQCSLLK